MRWPKKRREKTAGTARAKWMRMVTRSKTAAAQCWWWRQHGLLWQITRSIIASDTNHIACNTYTTHENMILNDTNNNNRVKVALAAAAAAATATEIGIAIASATFVASSLKNAKNIKLQL